MPPLYCRPCDIWWPTFNPPDDPGPEDDIPCPECSAPLIGPPP